MSAKLRGFTEGIPHNKALGMELLELDRGEAKFRLPYEIQVADRKISPGAVVEDGAGRNVASVHDRQLLRCGHVKRAAFGLVETLTHSGCP